MNQTAGAGNPAIAQAARTVFTIRQAIVIGPTPPGTGVIAPATSAHSAKATSPTSFDLPFCARHPVDADVDHGRARLDPVAAHHFRPADRGDQQIGAAAHRRQIAGLGMRDGHGGVFGQQKLRHRLADDVGAADHHRFEAGERGMHGLRQHDAAERRARHQRRQAGGEPPGVDRMEAVDVLRRIDGVEHLLGVDLLRQRQLHQDAVHRRIGVELFDQRHQLGLADAVRQPMIERLHAGFVGRLGLAADIGLARRIVAGQNDREPGRDAVLRDRRFTSPATLTRSSAAIALPSMMRAVTAFSTVMPGFMPGIRALLQNLSCEQTSKAWAAARDVSRRQYTAG